MRPPPRSPHFTLPGNLHRPTFQPIAGSLCLSCAVCWGGDKEMDDWACGYTHRTCPFQMCEGDAIMMRHTQMQDTVCTPMYDFSLSLAFAKVIYNKNFWNQQRKLYVHWFLKSLLDSSLHSSSPLSAGGRPLRPTVCTFQGRVCVYMRVCVCVRMTEERWEKEPRCVRNKDKIREWQSEKVRCEISPLWLMYKPECRPLPIQQLGFYHRPFTWDRAPWLRKHLEHLCHQVLKKKNTCQEWKTSFPPVCARLLKIF